MLRSSKDVRGNSFRGHRDQREKKDSNGKMINTMKEPITLKSWEDFEQALTEIGEETKRLREGPQELGVVSDPLFRGVSDSGYHLESTLDRMQKEMSLDHYNTIIKIMRKHVETCTGKKWELSENIFFESGLESREYEFMVYLRHNGFPSPLIDWSKSPHIAAFFAFRAISSERKQKGYVSIFVYREYCGMGKQWCGQEPRIHTIGPTIGTDRKHYLQQCEYSFCIKQEEAKWVFANHEDIAFDKNQVQNDLRKYNIPVSEQQKVLRKLDSMNITAYSLFNSEPSLMETLALREIVLK